MQRPWLAQYPPAVPPEIDFGTLASLKDVLAAGCARFAERPAFSSMGTVMTFRQLDEASRAFGAWLQKVAGLKRGDRVALMMPTLLQYRWRCSGRCGPAWWWSTSTRFTRRANSSTS